MLWENTDFIDGAVRSRVFCQLYQYNNCISGRKDAVNRRIAATRCEIGSVGGHRLKSCTTLADAIFRRGMRGALRQSDKIRALTLPNLSSGCKHVFWCIISGLVLKLTIN